MACTNIIPYAGTLPGSGTLSAADEAQACRDYRVWHNDEYIPWLQDNAPSLCAASDLANLVLYKGEWGAVDTPTTLNKGESVSIGDIYYVSKIDGNTDTPPSVNYITVASAYTKTEVDDRLLGVGQIRVDETVNRAFGVTYTNPSATKPMLIIVSFNVTVTSTTYQSVDVTTGADINSYLGIASSVEPDISATFIVFPGESYSVASGYNSPTLTKWIEVK